MRLCDNEVIFVPWSQISASNSPKSYFKNYVWVHSSNHFLLSALKKVNPCENQAWGNDPLKGVDRVCQVIFSHVNFLFSKCGSFQISKTSYFLKWSHYFILRTIQSFPKRDWSCFAELFCSSWAPSEAVKSEKQWVLTTFMHFISWTIPHSPRSSLVTSPNQISAVTTASIVSLAVCAEALLHAYSECD